LVRDTGSKCRECWVVIQRLWGGGGRWGKSKCDASESAKGLHTFQYQIEKNLKPSTLSLLIFLKVFCLFKNLNINFVSRNGLQLQEVGDYEAQNCLPPLNLIRSTKLHLTTEPPISYRCCYKLPFCLSWFVCPL
jgi:hypothetical protein